jgi:hypothetical protein
MRFSPFDRPLSAIAYAVAAPLLLLAQPVLVALIYRLYDAPLPEGFELWLVPMRSLAGLPVLSPVAAAAGIAAILALTATLAWLSSRRAAHDPEGQVLAALTMVPMIQLASVALLLFWPRREPAADEIEPEAAEPGAKHVLQGVLAGGAIVVGAVLVSAVTFGAYGWGLFVLTPFLVGVTTGFIVNRRHMVPPGRTIALGLAAAVLGSFALIAVALEGLVCILMAAPLAAAMVAGGAMIGREAASARQRGGPLRCIAVLPAVFALEAAMPPDVAFVTDRSIEIAASPAAVWNALVSAAPIESPPGFVARAGLAYPVRGRILRAAVGGERVGEFSTGEARERITAWEQGRRLAFRVIDQPPAMEEMSPYRRVHAPHVEGYFETLETRFDLAGSAEGRTRLRVRATHRLALDPALYWAPLARWAIAANTDRVLEDIRVKAERRR